MSSIPFCDLARKIRARRPLASAALLLGMLALAGPTRAQIADPTLWVTDGFVSAMAFSGDTLYIGGAFTYVGPNTGGFVGIDATTGRQHAGWPRVEGAVFASVPDGAGGWYIGGGFLRVAGVPRGNLAHLRADGTLDGWDPGPNARVLALAVTGSTVYAGGDFTSIGGQPRGRIAALDAATGLATAWNPGADRSVHALAVGGSTAYAAGDFTSIGGQPRSNIAALDAATGFATAWNPGADRSVRALAVSGSTVYTGGFFTSIGGQPRSSIAAIDAATGFATAWNPGATGGGPSSSVRALAVSGSTVYAGGGFTGIGGQPRSNIAALDAATGLATAWNPGADNLAIALAVSGSTVYAGGGFTSIGGQPRMRIAALDAATGLATGWNPGANGGAFALAVSGSTVYAGGDFTSIGGQPRSRIAAIDAATGLATAWNPGANNLVNTLAVSGSTVYAGGVFTSIGGQPRTYIAALDAATGLATGWNPGADFFVNALAMSGSTVYAGGQFSSIGGQPRTYIAALDAITGLATAWNPGANEAVYAIAVSGSKVYAGGFFTSIGGQPRSQIAALDAATGLATPWNPEATGGFSTPVSALAVSGSTVYAGGGFTGIGGQPRSNAGALDAASGLATAWNPAANGHVLALAVSGSSVYAGGQFTSVGGQFPSIGGQPRDYMAALDAVTGIATAWNPGANFDVYALAVSGSTVYAGGGFANIGGLATSCLARILPAPISSPLASVLSPNGGETANIGTTRRMMWSATTTAPGVESVDLYLSRSGALGPWELLAAGAPNTGAYDWPVSAPASASTCYLWVDARDYAGSIGSDISDAGFTIANGALAVDPPAPGTVFSLGPVAPNPVRDLSRLTYVVPLGAQVRLTLLDVQGRELAVLADGRREAGRYTVSLDASALRPGLHFVRMQAPGTDLKRRIVILR